MDVKTLPTHENHVESQEESGVASAENFQKFIYELFEKNGVLNDLRAYLRGHIVDVLKSSQSGNPLSCQKHFTQRLDLPFQALNMLIVEYLLRLEFSYSLSVFISEIPLANMVFNFAKVLLKTTNINEGSSLRFNENDVWSVLNYLGIKCDSEHALSIAHMYKSEEQPALLLCILKTMSIYHKEILYAGQGSPSQETLLSGAKSSDDTLEDKEANSYMSRDKCKHYTTCRGCQKRVVKLKDKCARNKKNFSKTANETVFNEANVESFMKNVDLVEKDLVDEMFEQLKTVYDTELQLVRSEEEQRVKRSMANHALLLRQRKDEMEEAFKARYETLESNVQQKKQFLWGLARALRDQRRKLAMAAKAVGERARGLGLQEDIMKKQLEEAECVLQKRGQEVRSQISNELIALEEHLENMRLERDNLYRERSQFEKLKELSKCTDRDSNQEMRSNIDMLQNEITVLKKYLECTRETKCLYDRGTMTEFMDKSVLNNEQGLDKCDEERNAKTPNLVVNDFKKPKNVNFSQWNAEEGFPVRGQVSMSIAALLEENNRLKALLTAQHRMLPAVPLLPSPSRPSTAPAATPRIYAPSTCASLGWRQGAGEELSGDETRGMGEADPRSPSHTVPFVGPMDRHTEARRHMMAWRALRRRTSPAPEVRRERSNSASPSVCAEGEVDEADAEHRDFPFHFQACEPVKPDREPAVKPLIVLEPRKTREKSPKSMLREAKEKLRNKDHPIRSHPVTSREKSPNAVLREAKTRLRKLEIEAEAVERSYKDFRKRQEGRNRTEEPVVTRDVGAIDLHRINSYQEPYKMEHIYKPTTAQSRYSDTTHSIKEDFDKYLREYQDSMALGKFQNKSAINKQAKPIPYGLSNIVKEIEGTEKNNENFLEQPLTEFRKLYQAPNSKVPFKVVGNVQNNASETVVGNIEIAEKDNIEKNLEAMKDALIKETECKQVELEILKSNITKIYNLQEPPTADTPEVTSELSFPEKHENDKNLLRVEIETVNEVNNVTVTKATEKPQDYLVLVEGTVNKTDVEESEESEEKISTKMTILISPKRSRVRAGEEKSDKNRSPSPEQAARLTRNDALDAIFQSDFKDVPSLEMQPDSKDNVDDSISEVEKEMPDDYPDDFSADVDNYDSRNSPISLPKTSEDENFWES